MGVAKIKKFNCREYEFSPLVRKIITNKGSKITEKGNERYDNEFPGRETSYSIGRVFLTVVIAPENPAYQN